MDENKARQYCCARMAWAINPKCKDHSDPFECPDYLVLYKEQTNEYGIIIHDGGNSTIAIYWCPWCGRRLAALPRKVVSVQRKNQPSRFHRIPPPIDPKGKSK